MRLGWALCRSCHRLGARGSRADTGVLRCCAVGLHRAIGVRVWLQLAVPPPPLLLLLLPLLDTTSGTGLGGPHAFFSSSRPDTATLCYAYFKQ